MDRRGASLVCVASRRHALSWDLSHSPRRGTGPARVLERGENEIRSAAEELAAFEAKICGRGVICVAEIQRRRGDLAAAEHSYLQAHELGRDPEAVLRWCASRRDGPRSRRQGCERHLLIDR